MAKIYSSRSESLSQNLKRFWQNRELFYLLVWRDIKVRYKQTLIGISWSVLQPLLMMMVFTLIFGISGKIKTGIIPYPLFVYTGLLFWNLFARSITTASESIIANRNLVKNSPFPKIILPFSVVIVNLFDFIAGLIVLFFLMLVYGLVPHFISLFILPLTVIFTLALSIGLGSLLAIANTLYRDVRFLIPFGLQILLFLTPIIYSESFVAEKYRIILSLNPLSGIIELARASLFNPQSMNGKSIIIGVIISGVLLLFGIHYFCQKENYSTDTL